MSALHAKNPNADWAVCLFGDGLLHRRLLNDVSDEWYINFRTRANLHVKPLSLRYVWDFVDYEH